MTDHQVIIVPAILSTSFPLVAVMVRAHGRRILLAAALSAAVAVSLYLAAVLRMASLVPGSAFDERVRELLVSPVPLLMAGFVLSVTFGRERPEESLRSAMRVLFPLGLLGLILVSAHGHPGFLAAAEWADGKGVIRFGLLGKAYLGYLLLGIVLIGDNVEKTYRVASGHVRWRVRAALFGFFGVLGFFSFVLAAGLLSATIRTGTLLAAGIPIGGASLLIGVGCLRGALAEPVAPLCCNGVRTSFTLVAAGLAALSLTVAAGVAGAAHWTPEETLVLSIAILAALMAALLTLSDHYQRRIRRFLDLRLHTGRHDYRGQWTRITEVLADATDREALLDRLPDYVRQAFAADAVTVAMCDAAGRLRPVRGKGAGDAAETAEADSPLCEELTRAREALLLDGRPHDFTYLPIYAENQGWLDATASRLIAPLFDGDRLVGAIGLERDDIRDRLTYQDAALLESVAAHVTAALRGMHLAEELALAGETEAVSLWSGVVLRDLRKCLVPLEMVAADLSRPRLDSAANRLRAADLRRIAHRLETLSGTLAELRTASTPQMSVLDPNDIVRAALTEMQMDRWPLLALQLQLDSRHAIRGDRPALQRLMRNLVANAIEAMGGTGSLTVTTRDHRAGGTSRVRIAIGDTGKGIPETILKDRLFKPFATTKKKRLGLGLWQCRMIVQAHGGEISVDSRRGRGTVFHVMLDGVPPQKRMTLARERERAIGRVLDRALPGR
jgi:putative PEP-CTERM system histidine kinase